jgi:hypothetical protein
MNPQARDIAFQFQRTFDLPDVFFMVRSFATALLRLRLCTIVDDDGFSVAKLWWVDLCTAGGLQVGLSATIFLVICSQSHPVGKFRNDEYQISLSLRENAAGTYIIQTESMDICNAVFVTRELEPNL